MLDQFEYLGIELGLKNQYDSNFRQIRVENL